MIGQTVGSYRITAKVSVGGMGTVYRAEHTLIGKTAAVKVLHPELTGNRDIVNRFFNEAKATTTIHHPGIVEVFDFGYLPSGHAFLVMEFLDGMPLSRRLKERGVSSEGEAAMLLRAVCSALSAAHGKGIVHRDLKPDNIFMVPDPDTALGERPKLLDFGIAKLTDIGLAGTATKTGAVMGTPTYMSPEQCKGTGEVDHRADLYSLGCILYELLVGHPPFTSLGAGELIGAHLFMQPPAPTGLSAETTSLVMALLAKDPALRPQTAKELGQRLTRIAQNQGWITATSPTAITADSLADLPIVPPGRAGSAHDDATLPSRPNHTPPVVGIADKPTTLSGAASQSVVDYPKRRRGLGIAAAAAITLAGGGIAIGIAMSGSKPKTPATAPHKADPSTAKATTPDPAPHGDPSAKTDPATPDPSNAGTTSPDPATGSTKPDPTETDTTKPTADTTKPTADTTKPTTDGTTDSTKTAATPDSTKPAATPDTTEPVKPDPAKTKTTVKKPPPVHKDVPAKDPKQDKKTTLPIETDI
jgi:serine/threonine-protein kinase